MLKIPDIFPRDFFQHKPHPSEVVLDSSCRGKTKGALSSEFQGIGMLGSTSVFLRQDREREIISFEKVPDDAVYRGRANKVGGIMGGMYHSFSVPEASRK